MTCQHAQEQFSSYVDTALPGSRMQELRGHLRECGACAAEFRAYQKTVQMVGALGPRPAPADLALRIRIALAQERDGRRQRMLEGFLVRFEDTVRAFMLPATAGVLSAFIFFGLLIGFWATPVVVGEDVPLPQLSYRPPQLAMMPADSIDVADLENAGPIVVETFVDAQGRVQDYRILTPGVDVKAIEPQLDSIMIFTLFEPARSFGRPAPGRAVISFSNVQVKG